MSWIAKVILKIKQVLNLLISKNKKRMSVNSYEAKRNDDGTIDMYQVGTAIGVDFNPVSVLNQTDTNVNIADLTSALADAQSKVDDLQARIDAINALPAVTPSADAAAPAASDAQAQA